MPEQNQDEIVRLNKSDTPGYFLGCAIGGVFVAGAAYILTAVMLGAAGFTYDSRPGIPIIGNPWALLLFKILLFAVPFVLTALYLRFVFRHSSRRTLFILSALLLTWTAEKLAILGISAMLYGIRIWNLPELMHRISAGGDQSAPWFTWDYLLFTLAGCIILGLIASVGKRAVPPPSESAARS